MARLENGNSTQLDEIIHDRTMDLLAARIVQALRQRDNAKMMIRDAKTELSRAKDHLETAELELAAWSSITDSAGIRIEVTYDGTVRIYGR